MAIEQGIVVSPGNLKTNTVWVKTLQPAACESCASRKSCKIDMAGQTREIEVINSVGAKVGDNVQISMRTSALLKAIFLLYLFPILCMLVGGLAGQIVSNVFGFNDSITSMVFAVCCFIAAMGVVRIRGGKMALKSEFQPKITRVLTYFHKPHGDHGTPGNCSLDVTNSP